MGGPEGPAGPWQLAGAGGTGGGWSVPAVGGGSVPAGPAGRAEPARVVDSAEPVVMRVCSVRVGPAEPGARAADLLAVVAPEAAAAFCSAPPEPMGNSGPAW